MGQKGTPMNVDARHLAIGMKGAWDVFRKFEWETAIYNELAQRKVPLGAEAYIENSHPLFAAINAASTAWSLVEWVWFEVELHPEKLAAFVKIGGTQCPSDAPNLDQLKHELRRTNSALDVCHQVAHAAKHVQLRTVTKGLSTEVTFDVWQRAGYLYWSTNASVRRSPDDTGEPIERHFDQLKIFWRKVLSDLAIPDRANSTDQAR